MSDFVMLSMIVGVIMVATGWLLIKAIDGLVRIGGIKPDQFKDEKEEGESGDDFDYDEWVESQYHEDDPRYDRNECEGLYDSPDLR